MEDMLYLKDLYEQIKGDKLKKGDMTNDYDWDILHRKCVPCIKRCDNPSM